MGNERIKSSISFYKLCNKLKDTIRKGPVTWNVKRERIESVAEHVYGTQMLAIAILLNSSNAVFSHSWGT